jgi:hypothetical protein
MRLLKVELVALLDVLFLEAAGPVVWTRETRGSKRWVNRSEFVAILWAAATDQTVRVESMRKFAHKERVNICKRRKWKWSERTQAVSIVELHRVAGVPPPEMRSPKQ